MGFEKELRWFYFDKENLKGVMEHTRALIDKGQVNEKEDPGEEEWNDDSIGSLTMGAIITLKVGGYTVPPPRCTR
jgi:ubiquitin-conjugating enzyme E2 O